MRIAKQAKLTGRVRHQLITNECWTLIAQKKRKIKWAKISTCGPPWWLAYSRHKVDTHSLVAEQLNFDLKILDIFAASGLCSHMLLE